MRKDLGTDFNCDLCGILFHSHLSGDFKPDGWTMIRATNVKNNCDTEVFLACNVCWRISKEMPKEAKKTMIQKLKEKCGIL